SVRMLRQYSVDGVIVASSTLPLSFARAFRDAGMPVVHSFGRHAASPNVHVVGIDNVACGEMAVRTLVEHGYRRIAFLGGPEEATSTQDRLTGFLNGVQKHEDVEASYSFADAYSFEAGRVEMTRLLEAAPAHAYFCGDDVLSIGAMSAVSSKGLRVPDDIGLIGLNDMEIAGWQNINLTTIHQPIRQIIEASIELIMTMLANPERSPEARLFPCKVVERGTLMPKLVV
ncbi:MAG: substrate-binding domain-containing protein, partial [Geminicoccaceae bacterium]